MAKHVVSHADSGLQYCRVSQCECEALLFVFECVVFDSFGCSRLIKVCYDVGCVVLFCFLCCLDGLSQRRVGLSYALRVFPAVTT